MKSISDCWETWSRCSTWSSGLTGIAWQSCPQRCQCLGWETGTCEERPSKYFKIIILSICQEH
jgi:hypothetical protein